MAVEEKNEEVKEEKSSKFKSRKFLVWVWWSIVVMGIEFTSGAVMLLTKKISESLVDFMGLGLILWLFVTSFYFGVNLAQKISLEKLSNRFISIEDNSGAKNE